MSKPSEHLERLISRFLDDECTPTDRRELRATLRSDPAAQSMFDEHEWLDRETGHALRRALGRSAHRRWSVPFWQKFGRGVAIAAAACLATAVWLGPLKPHLSGKGPARAGQADGGESWFMPAGPECDTLEPPKPGGDRSHLRLRDTNRDWIVIPGQRDGEYLLIEVDRVRTQVVRIQRDF